MSLRAGLLWIVIGSLLLAGGLGLAAVAGVVVEERLVFTALMLGVFSLLALGALVVMERRVLVPLMWVGVGAAAVAFGLLTVGVWISSGVVDSVIMTPGGVASVVAVWAPAFGLLCVPTMHGVGRIVRSATLVAGSLLSASLVFVIVAQDAGDAVGRVLLALLIVTLVGVVLTPVLAFIARVRQGDQREERIDPRAEVELVCPRCSTHQRLLAGRRRCVKCGLRIALEIELPHCECGYLLLHIQGDVCPECGRDLAGG